MEHYCRESRNDISGFHKLEHQWKIGEYEGTEWFFHWFDLKSASILDYLAPETLLIWDDIVPLERRLDQSRNNYLRHLDRAPEIFLPLLSPPEKLLFSNRYTEETISCFDTVFVDTLDLHPEVKTYTVSFSEQPQLPYEVRTITDNIKDHFSRSYHCFLVCPNSGHVERMKELLSDDSFALDYMIGFLSRGIIDHDNRVVFYSESQIVKRPLRIQKEKKRSHALPITGYDALVPDDFVVHEDHGIARFLGIEHVTAGDLTQDCMVLLYGGGTKIYVPVQDFYKVQKYIGKDAHTPPLSKIGSSSWEKLKTRTRESVKKMAAELIQLYAKRQFLEGIQYEKDTIWQKEFEETFIYTETPDQILAVKDIKEDMESSRPMDRLVCGDVGFGKTEVAMRAAFKAVMSGYQVAVLAPTTILVAQHFNTFTERMSNFPLKIAVLSRFVKTKKQKEHCEDISSGAIDIIIGTHRILSKDISFKNLGLLIIDEEQRFGVQHKERIKQLRYKVDVLSLTATPIPRTLHLSLIGARDLSIITTPPQNRLPIETTVCPYHEERVRDAVENEMERGGQIYFVNNRICTLEQLKDSMEQLVPRARVVIAHGQMNEVLLERIMKEFIAGRYDVLLSTVIIENGLDIPNVNTIIVNRADTMGLSQLYQLRGRVGRSSEQAYSFFFTPPFKEMSDVSLKRLKALEQYTELGSGFQIAMRDLEIRGAGNILGTRQHGYIEAIGFELYCRILREAIDEIKGTAALPQIQDTKIEIPLEAYIPTDYVQDGPARILLYQDLSSLTGIEMVSEFEQSLIDRFGPLPQTVNSLLLIIKIKILASALGISKVKISNSAQLSVIFCGNDNDIKNLISLFIVRSPYKFHIRSSTPISIDTTLVSSSTITQAVEVLELLIEISQKNR
jgi:transcription-repair coupling factor (superfamily II helicase)